MIKSFRLHKTTLMELIGQLTAMCLDDDVYKVSVTPFKKSLKDRQRALANIWYSQLDKALGEPVGYSEALCKYRWGLKIRCRDDLDLENIIRSMLDGHSYEDKLAIIQKYSEWFPVMRANGGLDAEGQAEYLQCIQQCFAQEGIMLTTPKDDELLNCREANR